ncbi:putative short chain dehydrogenase [Aspergillus taichungensis]|uniref:Putative short chain dehydrogenase n=1 Tax=Aspergillus taichungensis TaxID=482145 RepID=A0A2J5HGK7_9EURO|nr:putative short chain dehydrogenase [Aspergillus taichungensis]
MSVYVVTGVSRGIGFEFLRQLSEDPKNLVVGLVRDKAATEQKIAAELGDRPNVHILHGDLTDYATLKQAATDTAEIVGERGVDYIVANGGLVSSLDAYGPIGALTDKVTEVEAVSSQLWRTNVIGNMHLFNLFIHLVLKGQTKKIITISSGMADLDFINNCEVDIAGLYAASKAALNVIVAKFNAQYKKDGVLFLSISPGLVDVGRFENTTPEEAQGLASLMGNLVAYAPHFKGPITPEESVRHIRSTWEKASIEGGFGGAFISHLGNKQWV